MGVWYTGLAVCVPTFYDTYSVLLHHCFLRQESRKRVIATADFTGQVIESDLLAVKRFSNGAQTDEVQFLELPRRLLELKMNFGDAVKTIPPRYWTEEMKQLEIGEALYVLSLIHI